MKTAVILSARGFLGSTLAERWRARGDLDVVALDSAQCNLLDAMATHRAFAALPRDFTLVFLSAFGRTPRDDFHIYDQNEKMARNLVAALQHARPRSVIYTSSACVYGRPPLESPISETSSLCPTTHYGLSKYVTECLLRLNLSCPLTILRIPGTYGKRDRGVSVASQFVAAVAAGRAIRVDNGGEQLRDFLFADDFVSVVEQCIENPYSGILNVSSGDPVSMIGLARLVSDCMGVSPRIEIAESSAPNFDLVFDRSRLTHWAPKIQFTSIANGIRSLIS